jgi:hypothetical protein
VKLKMNMSAAPEDREFWQAVATLKEMCSKLDTISPGSAASEQTFTGQFEGNIPERLECIEKTITQFRKAHTCIERLVREE